MSATAGGLDEVQIPQPMQGGTDGSDTWDMEAALERVSRGVAGDDPRPHDDGGVSASDEAAADSTPSRVLGRLASLLLRRPGRLVMAILWLAITVTAPAAAYRYAVDQPPLHGARIELLYERQGTDPLSEERQLATQMALARSRAVLELAAQQVGGISVEELDKALSVEVVSRSAFLQFTVADPDPQRAKALVRGVARHYVTSTQDAPQPPQGPDQHLVELLDLQRTIEARLKDLATQRRMPPPPPPGQPPDPSAERERLAEELDLRARLTDLGERLATAVQSPGLPRARIVGDAYVLSRPLRPSPLQGVAAAALVGTVIATVTVGALWGVQRRRAST